MAGNYFPAQVKVSPNFTEPGLIRTYAQPSGAFLACLPDGDPRTTIGDSDLFVYVNALDIRTEAVGAQAAGNFLPGVSLAATFYKTATYLLRNRCVYNHHDVSAASSFRVSLPSELETGQRQGIYMMQRNMLLYGFNPSLGEGLLNASGATALTLPADTYGHTTIRTYDPGQLALFWLNEIVTLQTGMFQAGMPIRVNLLGPQRILLQMTTAGIVQLTSYQRAGAGSETVTGVIQDITGRNRIAFDWGFDDTLIGKGAGSSDMVIMTAPKVEAPKIEGRNIVPFNQEQPQRNEINMMYEAFAAPTKITTPIAEGITSVLEQRSTSGWNWRPQGLFLVSCPY